MSATTKRKPARKRAGGDDRGKSAGAAAGRTIGERLQAAADRVRLNNALARVSELEARLGTRDDHEARLTAIDGVLLHHRCRIVEIEASAVAPGLRARLRWLLTGRG